MQLRITRLVILSEQNDLRAFRPGLIVDVDAATAEAILQRQAGIVIEPATTVEPITESVQPVVPTTTPSSVQLRTSTAVRRRKSTYAPA